MGILSEHINEKSTAKKLSPKEWLENVAEKAEECVLATHVGKFSHPDTKTSLEAISQVSSPDGYLYTANTTVDKDIVVNAAYLATANLLLLKLKDGKTVFEHLQADTKEIREELSAFADYEAIREALLKNRKSELFSDSRIRQVYFPLGDGEYDLLTVLPASSLAFEVKHRIRGFSAEAGERISNLIDISFGGTKPQNISALNSKEGGRVRLLPSVPPELAATKLRKPKHDFFRNTLYARRYFSWFRELHKLLISDRNNLAVRTRIKNLVQDIMEMVLQEAVRLQSLAGGWSDGEGFSLPLTQKYWLDQKYLAENQQNTDWQSEICDSLARWFLLTYERTMGDEKCLLGDAEFAFFRRNAAMLIAGEQEGGIADGVLADSAN